MDILSTAAQNYMATFNGYVNQFLQWGEWLFFSLLVINVVWLALWYAFDRHSFSESMPSFIKKFFIITFFYTVMMNPSWLSEILKTVQFMGSTLTHSPIDPSSLISQGIGIGNQVIIPIAKSSILTLGLGLIVIAMVYVIVLFVFISIALDLALTLILTTALISIATFFLGFAALGATTQIARQTLDVILANCIKLLGIYLVVAAGSQTIMAVASTIPTEIVSFDPYAWIVAVVLLFWLIAKNLPNQLAKIVSGAFHETQGTEAAALAMAATSYSRSALPALKLATNATGAIALNIGKLAGSTLYNAGAHFNHSLSAKGSVARGINAAVGGSLTNLGQSVTGNVSDRFKNITSKLAGEGNAYQRISSVPERMNQAAKDLHTKGPPSTIKFRRPNNTPSPKS
jgi:P-type conjugative transfer protein TrbL